MSEDYGSHADFMKEVTPDADARSEAIEQELRSAFADFIEIKEFEVVCFSEMSALDLAAVLRRHPRILKSLLLVCNIAARGIERDLGIKGVNTYEPKLTAPEAQAIAGYIKPFLPPLIAIRSLCELDRTAFLDKEIRRRKGGWEKRVLSALSQISGTPFKKRKFKVSDLAFELDAAYPAEGPIKIGIDVKRIEARRDIHKRCDEIINKALKLREAVPLVRFGAVIYYPFIQEHVNVSGRLRSPAIESVVFAGESEESVRSAVRMLLDKLA